MKPARFTTKACRSCGAITSVLAVRSDPPNYRFPQQAQLSMGSGRYFDGGLSPAYVVDGEHTPYVNGALLVFCRGCGLAGGATRVSGTYNPNIKCNAKCTHAKGFSCECSCGGRNHGAGYEK